MIVFINDFCIFLPTGTKCSIGRMLAEVTAWFGPLLWGVTLPPVIEANPGKRHRDPLSFGSSCEICLSSLSRNTGRALDR
jgi:hypothetical protein